MKDPIRIYFGLLKILVKYKMKLKLGTRLSTYHFSSLYTTLAHNLIKDIRIDLIERNFQRECSLVLACLCSLLACNDRNTFFTSE